MAAGMEHVKHATVESRMIRLRLGRPFLTGVFDTFLQSLGVVPAAARNASIFSKILRIFPLARLFVRVGLGTDIRRTVQTFSSAVDHFVDLEAFWDSMGDRRDRLAVLKD